MISREKTNFLWFWKWDHTHHSQRVERTVYAFRKRKVIFQFQIRCAEVVVSCIHVHVTAITSLQKL